MTLLCMRKDGHNPSPASRKACKNEPPQCLVLQKKDTNVKKSAQKEVDFLYSAIQSSKKRLRSAGPWSTVKEAF